MEFKLSKEQENFLHIMITNSFFETSDGEKHLAQTAIDDGGYGELRQRVFQRMRRRYIKYVEESVPVITQ